MEMKITNEQQNELDYFDGELIHPSLDFKNDILTLGFRYRSKTQEEKDLFVITHKKALWLCHSDSFTVEECTYHIEKRKRKLIRIEEKWSVTALQKFIKDYVNLKCTPDLQKTFQHITDIVRRYIELEQDIDYLLLAAWIIGTYFSPLFYAFPFLHLKAPKRSGKSQCLNLLTKLCFNAIKARPSLPALSDTVDSLRGTYLIDQADALHQKGKEELLDILADSYKQGGGKRRVLNITQKGGRETLEFETYGPKAFASIKELPEDLRDRCLVVPLIRSQKNFPDPDDSYENWREVRGEIYQIQLTGYQDIAMSYQFKKITYRQNPQEISGRTLELWLPFEVVLECCGVKERVVEAKKRFLTQYGFSEYEPSELEEAVIKIIADKLQDQAEIILTPKMISELIDSEMFSPIDSPKQKASKVGWAIKKFNMSSEKMPRTKEGVRYKFEKGKLEGVYQSYFKTKEDPALLTPAPSDGLNAQQNEVQNSNVDF